MRINFDATDRSVTLLERLQKQTGTTKKGVIIAGLLHLKWCVDQINQGRVIVAIDPEDSPRHAHHFASEFSLTAENRAEEEELMTAR